MRRISKEIFSSWLEGRLIHDRNDRFKKEVVKCLPLKDISSTIIIQVVPSLIRVSRKALGISTLLQAAVPKILETVPQSYYENTMSLVEVSNNSSIISDCM